MSIVQNPLIGRASGKMSNVIFQTSYDKNVIRSRPVAYRDAETQAQLGQRSRFFECLKYTQKLLPAARTGLARVALNKSVYNYLLGYIMRNAWTLQGSIYKVDPNLCITSKGDLLGFSNLHAEPSAGMIVEFLWSDNSGQQHALPTDFVYAVFFCNAKNEATYSLREMVRDDISMQITFPESWNGEVVQCWFFFKDQYSSLVSNSEYLEVIPFIV